MTPFHTLQGIAAPLDQPNADTDQIAPARFLRRPRQEGYSRFLFHDLRVDEKGLEKVDFVLNHPGFKEAKILVVNRNFGGGSSREQAVWCLVDYGIRCVIGSTFGDIFYNNSINHGLLLIKQDEDVCKQLRDQLHATPGTTMSVDLPNQSFMGPDGQRYSFTIEEIRKKRLLDGLDEIGLTLEYVAQMNAFETDFRKKHPWLFRPSTSST